MAYALLQNISVSYGDRDILRDVSLSIDSTARIALAGENGSGKTTFLKVAAGLGHPDTGEVQIQKESIVSYLPQSGLVFEGKSVLEEADTAFLRFHRIEERKTEIEMALESSRESDDNLERLLSEHAMYQQTLVDADYYDRERKIRRVLMGLGFESDDLSRRTEEFSGGWQMRIGLAKVLLENPDIVLLDEPTNYLDIEARTWLETYLAQFKGGVVVVSHDKYFLDVTVNSVAELFRGRLTLYRGNYTDYERQRDAQRESLLSAYKQQQVEIERIEAFIRRFRAKPTKAAQVQSRIRQLEKLERIEIPESMKRIAITFPPAPHSGKIVLRAEGLSRKYGELSVLNDVDFTLERGNRLVIAGKNGAGKSTLMRILAGADTQYTGNLRLGAGVKIGYFSQDLDSLPRSGTVLEAMEAVAATSDTPRLRDMLGAFLFRGDDVYKPIAVLSGGEKSRLALLLMLLHPTNLLILDEPTNHLDMASKRVLLDALEAFAGTLIFVSHDRYFIEALADNVLELKAGRWRMFPGDYAYYLWRIEEESAHGEPLPEGTTGTATQAESVPDLADTIGESTDEIEDTAEEPTAYTSDNGGVLLSKKTSFELPGRPPRGKPGDPQITREQEKELRKQLRRLESEEAQTLSRLEVLDREHTRIQDDLSKEENYTDGEAVRTLTASLRAVEAEQTTATEAWTRLEDELTSIRERLTAAGRSI